MDKKKELEEKKKLEKEEAVKKKAESKLAARNKVHPAPVGRNGMTWAEKEAQKKTLDIVSNSRPSVILVN